MAICLRLHRNWILLFETIMILMIIESYVTLDHEQFIYFQF
jgi:hypothetical protein